MKLPKLLGALLALLATPLAAQVSFTGSYTQNFNGMATGTAAPAGWTFHGAIGGDKDSWTTSIPVTGTPSAVTAGTANATLSVNSNAGAGVSTSNTAGYNLALAASTSDRCVGCSPTSGAGLIWQLRLTNNTPAPLTAVRIGYDLRRFTTVTTVEQVPGQRLFVSSNGGTSWTNVSALNPVRTGGAINVPSDSTGVTSVPLTTVTLPASVAVGAEVRFRWIDDNGDPSPDQIIGLDNVVVQLPQEAPTVSLTAPAANAAYALPATVELTAEASDSDGTVTLVEFFANGTKIGQDDTSPYALTWSGMISGAYALTAKATDNAGGATTSTAVNISITNPNNAAPSVAITSPVNNTTILTDSVGISATATDGDGVVSKVEFFNGATKLGEDTSSPFIYNWTGIATGSYTLTSVATDNDGAVITSAPVNISVAVPVQTILIPRRVAGQGGAEWLYNDDRVDLGTTWMQPSYDDGIWDTGRAPLGYGDSHVFTVINSGPSGDRIITTYFRGKFNVTNAAAVQALTLNILRDDGVVVYINGTEVARQNMPAGPVTYLTFSSSIADGANETTYFNSSASPLPVLNDGENTIAVELHNRDGNSSDAGFDLELIALSAPGTPPTVALTSPADGAAYTAPAVISLTADASDSDGTVSKVEFFNGLTKVGEDTTAPFAFDWTVVPQGNYTLTARATDNYGQSTTSTAVAVSVAAPDTLPPTVAITAPAAGAPYLAPATVVINADAADSDGTVTKVEFFNGATRLGEDTSSPYSFTWSNVAAGSYSITARATDNLTATGTSIAVTVTVDANLPPSISLTSPANLASVPAPVVNLQATVSDPNEGAAGHQPLSTTFYGREKGNAPGADFTLMTLPDTQFYSENSGGTRLPLFTSQTNWIVNSRTTLNTAFVAHMGDMVNTASVAQEWTNAKGAMSIIENPTTTGLLHGMPWGGAPGNHDGTGTEWDTHFGPNRFTGRDYYQGGYNNSNRNNYQFFSASGMDFIVINLAYNSNTAGNQAVMDWADALLKAHPNRRAIVTSHWLVGISFPPTQAAWGGHGQTLYDNLKDNPNLFLMLCGHIHGEGRRVDTFEGRTIYTVLQDYQGRTNGGDSWLRYFTFKPAENKIYAYTYKTNTSTYETDADSQFTLDYNMSASAPWTPLGTVTETTGAASLQWTGLGANKEYEWYAAVSDGATPVGSTVRSFTTTDMDTTAPVVTPPANVIVEATGVAGASVTYAAATATDNAGVTSLTYSHASGDNFPLGVTTVTVTAKDAANNTGTATFTVTVTPSANAALASLSVNGAALSPDFSPATLDYDAGVPYAVTELNVDAAAAFPGATIQQTPANPVPLSVGPNVVDIQVTAQDGTTQTLYQVTVNRAGPAAISLSQPVYTVNQGATSIAVTLTRTEATTAASVILDANNGTASTMPPFAAALEGIDYVDLVNGAREVSFAVGEMSKSIQIVLVPKTSTSTPNKRLTIALSSPGSGAALGAITTAVIEILVNDALKPTLTVTAPIAGTAAVPVPTVSAPSPYLVKGLAGDAKGLDRVEVVLNGAAPVNAVIGSATANTSQPYSLSIEPVQGVNTLVATAYDLRGNATSLTRTFNFVQRYVLSLNRTAPDGIALDAAGTVAMIATPATAASALTPATANSNPKTSTIVPGTPVKLTATPKVGYVFSHWSGLPSGASALGNVLTFTMPSEDVSGVTANFVANPFFGPAGASNIFYGLIHPVGAAPSNNSTEGFFTGTLTPTNGSFSGKVLIDGVSQSFLAYFYGDGTALFNVGTTKQYSLVFGGKALTLNFAAGAITAEVTNSAHVSIGTATRGLYSATNKVPADLLNVTTTASAPAPNKGSFTIGFPTKGQSPALPADAYPQGDGFGTLAISDIGAVTLSGTLADGTLITGASALVAGNTCPIFVQLTAPGAAAAVKGGSFSGTLTFDTSAANSDVSGTDLLWFRPTVTPVTTPAAAALATNLYTAGWPNGIHVDAVGALYDKTATIEASLGLAAPNVATGNGRLMFTDGKLTSPVTKTSFNITGNVVSKTPDPVKVDATYTLTLTPTTGAFSGTFTPNWATPSTAKPAFKGILIQKGVNQGGFGYFLSNAKNDLDPESGGVTLGKP